jgi:hypothetical protein
VGAAIIAAIIVAINSFDITTDSQTGVIDKTPEVGVVNAEF